MTLKNMLGLVWDPVAGLVEVPCVKRNAGGASLAIVSADMALAGVTSRIPCDEVIGAMYKIGVSMPARSEERRVGKESRCRWGHKQYIKKREMKTSEHDDERSNE